MNREGRGRAGARPLRPAAETATAAPLIFAVAKAFELKHPRRPKAASGELNANARWTWAIARAIRAAHAKGESNVEIARRFGVNRGTVFKIINNQQWIEMKKSVYVSESVRLMRWKGCPECGAQLDGAMGLAFDRREQVMTPSAGDVSVCFHCGSLLEYQRDLTVARLPPETFATLPKDRRRLLTEMSLMAKRGP